MLHLGQTFGVSVNPKLLIRKKKEKKKKKKKKDTHVKNGQFSGLNYT
ncbi:hypothetical protein GMES_3360 [Paraglaciecola mesophila KMM 241]|uniref:Uncharacterized protein n=1 Tax=Paraglaciecola mesophila KMM 241 TaxID=1128912 RepID=K6Z5G6_9ALTE|nr:hypothetical protein GMES_3360 [Paraglaciecola mesophila KMM 241]